VTDRSVDIYVYILELIKHEDIAYLITTQELNPTDIGAFVGTKLNLPISIFIN